MPRPQRKYDELGFPIPATFEDLPQRTNRDELPAWSNAGTPSATLVRRKRIVLGIALVAIVFLAAGPFVKGVGETALARLWARQAEEKFFAGDMAGTVADATRALDWGYEEPKLVFYRAAARRELNDLEGALEDLNRLVAMPRPSGRMLGMVYQERAWVNVRLQNYREAIDDATKALALSSPNNAELLNHRAYIRALANLNREELEAGLKDIELALEIEVLDPAAFIDTRAYLLHLLGRNEEALAEMNKAIDQTLHRRAMAGRRSREIERANEDLAVMYHHRGLIHRALKNEKAAAEDLSEADRLGYDPEQGVF